MGEGNIFKDMERDRISEAIVANDIKIAEARPTNVHRKQALADKESYEPSLATCSHVLHTDQERPARMWYRQVPLHTNTIVKIQLML